MKKQLIIVAVLAFTLGLIGTAFAAAPFPDVPAKHWAYDAVGKLVQAGLIEGYDDNTFKGDRPMSRYEFALLTAKAMSRFDKADDVNKAMINKLSAEFAAELQNLGIRVDKLEKKVAQDTVNMKGDMRLRWDRVQHQNNSSTRERFRLHFSTNPVDNITFNGTYLIARQTIINNNATSPGGSAYNGNYTFTQQTYDPYQNNIFALGYATVNKIFGQKDMSLVAGRMVEPFLSTSYFLMGYGIDGAQLNFGNTVKVNVGYANFSNAMGKFGDRLFSGVQVTSATTPRIEASGAAYYTDAVYATIKAPIGDKTTVYGMYLENTIKPNVVKVYGLGLKANLSDQLTLKTDYTTNESPNAGNNGYGVNSYVVQLQYRGADAKKPKSWGVGLENSRIDHDAGFYSSDFTTGSPTWGANAKQSMIYANYTLAKNLVFSAYQTFNCSNATTGAELPKYTRAQIDLNF